MKIRIRCFASVRELFGSDEIERELPEGATLAQLRSDLAREQPRFADLPTAQAVNREYATPDRVLREGDEVAFIPPISGGGDTMRTGREAPRRVVRSCCSENRSTPGRSRRRCAAIPTGRS
jgi:molybdopterin converting factor subunit 1